jgi:hypothetical protein
MICVNLIPMHRRQQRRLRARRSGWVMAASVYAVLLIGSYGIWRWVWSDDADLGSKVARIQEEIDDASRNMDRVSFSLNETRVALLIEQSVNGQPDWSMLLAMLADLRGEDIVLKNCLVDAASETIRERPPETTVVGVVAAAPQVASPERAVVRLQGYGRSQAVVAQFVLRLEQAGLFDDVSLVKTNREPFMDDHAMSFQVDCQLKVGIPDAKGDAKRDAERDPPSRRVAGADAGGSVP